MFSVYTINVRTGTVYHWYTFDNAGDVPTMVAGLEWGAGPDVVVTVTDNR